MKALANRQMLLVVSVVAGIAAAVLISHAGTASGGDARPGTQPASMSTPF
jgi:hypothetical protein